MEVAIDRTRGLGAIVVGRVGLDLYPDPDGTKIENAERYVTDLGGSAGNIAVALARQGARAALISPLSDDAVGRFVRMTMATYQVNTSRCRAVAGDFRTSLAVAETRASDCEVVIYRNGAADLQMDSEDVDAAFIADASVLILTGTALAAEPSRSASMASLAAGRAAGTFTILDIDHRSYSWTSEREAASVYTEAAGLCDAVVGNEHEFGLLAGGREGALAAATDFVRRGRAFAILKKGVEGSVTITPASVFDTGIVPVAVKKPFGAGDAFMGGLVSALLGGLRIEDAVRRGAASAALVVSRRGCASAMPTADEVDLLLSRHQRTSDAHSPL